MGPGPFSFSGEHYTITDYEGLPKPVQAPCPPIMIGGGGKRVLSIAAREADIVGINGNLNSGVIGAEAIATMTEEAVVDKVGIVADAARAAGRLDAIELHLRMFVTSVTDDRDETLAEMSAFAGLDPVEFAAWPYALVGSVEQIADDLIERRERFGFSYLTVSATELESLAPVVARLTGT